MIRVPFLMILLTVSVSLPEMFSHYRLKQQAEALYAARDFSRAENVFRQLLLVAPEGKESSSAGFNLACALYMQKKYSDAAALFSSSREAKGAAAQPALNARFNEGSALAMKAFETSEKKSKRLLLHGSLGAFRRVLLSNPEDGDAKINYEIVRRALQELEEKHSPSSTSPEQRNSSRPETGIGRQVASRLLEKARQDESSMMQRIPRSPKAPQEGRNNKDW
ncbi:MAG: tetratricopeptide repeat protein [Chlorobiaceae bacterium]